MVATQKQERLIAKSTDKSQHRIDILIGGINGFRQRHLLFESCVQPVSESGIQLVHGTGVALENDASRRLHIVRGRLPLGHIDTLSLLK